MECGTLTFIEALREETHNDPHLSLFQRDSQRTIIDRHIIIYAILKNTVDKGAGLA